MARKSIWIRSHSKSWKPKVPDFTKSVVTSKAEKIIESSIKPTHVKEPPPEYKYNYLVDIFTKWHGRYFYFCSRYNCPGPNAISPFFDIKYARLEYVDNDRFNLSYMRHTEKWQEVFFDLSLEECLNLVAEDPLFSP